MSGVKHTPGPLLAIGNEVRKPLSSDSVLTVVVARCAGSNDEAEANAALYAAAPDLLEALESLVLMQAENRGDGVKTHLALSHLCVTARAAMARARGEQDGGGE